MRCARDIFICPQQLKRWCNLRWILTCNSEIFVLWCPYKWSAMHLWPNTLKVQCITTIWSNSSVRVVIKICSLPANFGKFSFRFLRRIEVQWIIIISRNPTKNIRVPAPCHWTPKSIPWNMWNHKTTYRFYHLAPFLSLISLSFHCVSPRWQVSRSSAAATTMRQPCAPVWTATTGRPSPWWSTTAPGASTRRLTLPRAQMWSSPQS